MNRTAVLNQSEQRCSCIDIPMGSYDSQVSVYTPQGKLIGLDICLLKEITLLWSKGVETIESCCGHNKTTGYIAVTAESIPIMQAMGYQPYPGRPEIFKPNP